VVMAVVVVVSWACTVMAIPSLPGGNSSLQCPAWSHMHGM
jgi:hypothetical protein